MKETEWRNRLSRILNDYPNQKIIRVVGTKNLDVKKSNYYEITPEQFKEIYDSAN